MKVNANDAENQGMIDKFQEHVISNYVNNSQYLVSMNSLKCAGNLAGRIPIPSPMISWLPSSQPQLTNDNSFTDLQNQTVFMIWPQRNCWACSAKRRQLFIYTNGIRVPCCERMVCVLFGGGCRECIWASEKIFF